MSHPVCPEYRKSETESLGKVPSGLKLVKVAYIFEKTNAGEVIERAFWHKGEELLYTCKRIPMLSDFPHFPDKKRTTDRDLLLTRNGTPYVHKPFPNSIYSNVVQRITLKSGFDRNYVGYALSNSALSLKGYGVSIESLNFEMWKDLFILKFNLHTQQAIANYLDRETARIDNLIAEKQTFINLLKEKRQTLISHVVTKGLDPNVKMKDSGIEWIGEVPEHWAVGKIGFFARVVNGSTPSKLRADYWDSKDVPWLSSGAVNQYYVSEATDYITELALKECAVELLPAGSLIVGMIGQGKTRGMSALTKIEATINQNIAAVIPKSGITSSYLHFVFQAAYKALRDVGRGANQAALNCDLIAQFKIPIPPSDEQNLSVSYLEFELLKINGLLAEVDASIGYLKEHRTALISAAVTGKIDVRNYKEGLNEAGNI